MENNNIDSTIICITKDEYDKLLEALLTLRFIRRTFEAKPASYIFSDVLKLVFGDEKMEEEA